MGVQSPLKTIGQVIGLQAALDDRLRGKVGDIPPVNPPADYVWIRTPGVTAAPLVDLRAGNSNASKTAVHANSDADATTWYDITTNARNFSGTGFPTPPTTSNGWNTAVPFALVLPGANVGGGVMSSGANRTPFNLLGDLTLEMWVKVSRIAGGNYGLVAYTNNGNGFAYSLDFGDLTQGVRFLLGTSPTVWATWQNPIANAFPNATWAQVLVSLASNVPVLYINGQAVDWVTNPTYAGSRQPLDTVNHPLYLANGSSAASVLNGSVGDVRIYNSALTAAQALANYNARKAAYGLA